MFGNRKDPMIDTVQKVMDENARRRQIEADLNEELGIQDRKQLGHEKHDLYDQALSQRINEAVLSPKQKSLAAIGGNPKKIDAPDLAKLRGMKNEAKDVEANEEPPFEPDVKKSTPWKNPQSKAKNMAREMMKKMKAKQDIKEEEQIDEERKRTSAVSSAFLAGKPAKQKELQTNGQEMTYHGNVIAKHAGDEVHVTTAGYGHSPSTRAHINGVLNRLGAPGLSQKKGKLMHGDTEVGTRDWIKIKKPTATMSEEQIDELSKKTLRSYIKKASHDAATKSAATGRYAERANKVKDETKKGDYSNYQQGKKDDETANKMFRKSWKRREFIAKAVDKLTNEDLSLESIQEEIRNNLLERANHLLENGSQDQIVEFMNDLTMEQRSILNLEEQVSDAAGGNNMDILKYANRSTTSTSPLKLPTDPGSFKLNIPTPQAVQPGPTPPAPRTGPPARARAMDSIVPPGLNSNNDDMSLGNGIVKSIGNIWTSMHTANRARVDKENDNQSKGSVTSQNRAAELGAAAMTGAPAPAPAQPPAPVAARGAAPATPPVAPVVAAAPAPAPRPPDNKEYDRQKQSALASAGKTADAFGPGTQTATPAAQQRTATPAPPPAPPPAPVRAAPAPAAKDDTWDNSKLAKTGSNGEETAQDFNRNQATYAARAASPRGQAERNMDESKTKYIPESITFERFLRNR